MDKAHPEKVGMLPRIRLDVPIRIHNKMDTADGYCSSDSSTACNMSIAGGNMARDIM